MEKNLVPVAAFLWRIKSDGASTVLDRGCLRIREEDARIEAVVLLSMAWMCRRGGTVVDRGRERSLRDGRGRVCGGEGRSARVEKKDEESDRGGRSFYRPTVEKSGPLRFAVNSHLSCGSKEQFLVS